MSYEDSYFRKLLKYRSDLEATKLKNEEATSRLRELEAKVAELEEKEKHWQEERRMLLRGVRDENA